MLDRTNAIKHSAQSAGIDCNFRSSTRTTKSTRSNVPSSSSFFSKLIFLKKKNRRLCFRRSAWWTSNRDSSQRGGVKHATLLLNDDCPCRRVSTSKLMAPALNTHTCTSAPSANSRPIEPEDFRTGWQNATPSTPPFCRAEHTTLNLRVREPLEYRQTHLRLPSHG